MHGLLKQRSNVQEALKGAAEKHPEVTESLKAILAGGKPEKNVRTKSSYYGFILNEIPPSSTHLWDEDQLKEAIKAHGITKIVPSRRSYTETLESIRMKPKMPHGIPHDRKQTPF
nr:unnamed protein product [Callosobruchus analis]